MVPCLCLHTWCLVTEARHSSSYNFAVIFENITFDEADIRYAYNVHTMVMCLL